MARSEQSVVPWSPFREFPFAALQLTPWMQELLGEPERAILRQPVIDVTESDGAYIVTAELPGVKKEDLTVECKNGMISIHGEKKSERQEKTEKGRLLERTYGSFSRSFTLPEDVNTDQTKASFQDGVLRIEIQKRPEVKAKTIAIKG
jgi:HSP20 family protein